MDDQQHTHDHPPIAGAIGGGAECLACPVCVLLQALASARPDVLTHLLAAGRELTLALQSLVDATVDSYERPKGRVQRIRVD